VFALLKRRAWAKCVKSIFRYRLWALAILARCLLRVHSLGSVRISCCSEDKFQDRSSFHCRRAGRASRPFHRLTLRVVYFSNSRICSSPSRAETPGAHTKLMLMLPLYHAREELLWPRRALYTHASCWEHRQEPNAEQFLDKPMTSVVKTIAGQRNHALDVLIETFTAFYALCSQSKKFAAKIVFAREIHTKINSSWCFVNYLLNYPPVIWKKLQSPKRERFHSIRVISGTLQALPKLCWARQLRQSTDCSQVVILHHCLQIVLGNWRRKNNLDRKKCLTSRLFVCSAFFRYFLANARFVGLVMNVGAFDAVGVLLTVIALQSYPISKQNRSWGLAAERNELFSCRLTTRGIMVWWTAKAVKDYTFNLAICQSVVASMDVSVCNWSMMLFFRFAILTANSFNNKSLT